VKKDEESPELDLTQPSSFDAGQVDSNDLPQIASPRLKSKDLEDLSGRKLGEFTLLRRLGHGGMAEVYLARQSSLNRNVAVKVLRPEMISDETHHKRFKQEAVAAGSMNHRNIVQVFMIGEQDGIHYIAQEYVKGQNLREFIDENESVPVELVIDLMIDIASALDSAGRAGIVHRDIKPENVLLDEKNNPKITDFGLAQLSLTDEKLNLTQVGMTMGTPLYMSPEQVHGGTLDQRSDIYSFGVTCYHLLSGEPPFQGETAISVALQHLNQTPKPLKEKRPELPTVLCDLVHRMMAKNPDERYPDAVAVLKDLLRIQAVLHHNPEAISKLALLIPEIGTVPKGFFNRISYYITRHQVVSILLCSVILGGISAVVGAYQRPRSPFDSPIPENTVRVPRQPSASLQYDRAKKLPNRAENWIAVIDYFPDKKDEYWRRWAKVELASLYLRTRRYDDALKIYDELAAFGKKDKAFRAFGYAGQAIYKSLLGMYGDSQQIIVDKIADEGLGNYLLGSDLYKPLDEAYQQNQFALGADVQAKLEDLFPLSDDETSKN